MHFRKKGFTLLELLIAIAVTSLIGLGVWQVLKQAISSKDVLERQSRQLEELQRLYRYFDRDMLHLVARPIRNEFGDEEFALTNRNALFLLEFSRLGWSNPLLQRRSEVQRVAYELSGDTLLRTTWQVVDRAQDSEPRSRALASGILEFKVEFLGQNEQWLDEWPTNEMLDAESVSRFEYLPAAVRFEFVHRKYGTLNLVYALAQNVGKVTKATEIRPQGSENEP